MSEEIGYIFHAVRDGVCWVKFYLTTLDQSDLCAATSYCGLGTRGFVFAPERIRVSDKPLLEKTPFKGAVSEVWIVEGSLRENGDGPVS